jgi:hypothetical protein
MASPRIIQLRHVLSGKFPGLRLRLNDNPAGANDHPPPGLQQIGELLQNGRSRGGLHEITADAESAGSATLIRWIIHRAAAGRRIIGLVDGCDSFDATQMDGADLAQLLWVRCPDAARAMKAADLLLRDGNLPVVILDLKFNPGAQLRKIQPTTWYRFQRLVETTSAACLVLTPLPMVAPAETRLTLHGDFSLADLWRDPDELLRELRMDVARTHHFHQEAGQGIA